MSTKIFTNCFCKNLKNPKNFHLYPLRRSGENLPFFTKFGDKGKSKTYCGEHYKDHKIFEAIGATEELNAVIGLAREFIRDDEKLNPLAEKLKKIQLVLVDITDIVSGLPLTKSSLNKTPEKSPDAAGRVTNRDIAALETLINHYGSLLPPVEKTVIPGGGKASASLHVAKSICRRCERILTNIFKDLDHEKDILAYLNRLSSYLSQAARISAKFANRSETIYKPSKQGECTGISTDK